MKALIIIDYMNELVHPHGKLGHQGYIEFLEKNTTLQNVKQCIEFSRKNSIEVIWIHLGFSHDYSDCSRISPRFSAAPKLGIFLKDTWSTGFIESIGYDPQEKTITKTRVSGFYNTDLDEYLAQQGIKELYICGIATDLAVSSLAREAHDRDYAVRVIGDACAAMTIEDHNAALRGIAKIGTIITAGEFYGK